MEPGDIVYQGKTSTGTPLVIRYPQSDDLDDLLSYINTLSKEKTFIRFQGEQLTLSEEKKYLDIMLDKLQKQEEVHFLAYSDNKLIGSAGIKLKDKVEKHIGEFGISIKRYYRSQGIGSFLTRQVLKEAEKNLPDLKIVTLSVYSNNPIAKAMYEKFGFREYGKLPKGILHRNKFVDHIFMYKPVR